MSIHEIINRGSPAFYEVEEMVEVVREYIKKEKGVEVDINIYKNVMHPAQHPFSEIILTREYQLLSQAFDVAAEKLRNYDYKN